MHRIGILFVGLAASSALGLATIIDNDVALLNHSPSMPVGIYLRSSDPIVHGAIVTVRARDVAPDLAHERGFDGDGDRFIKRVRAAGGQSICSDGSRLEVDGRVVVEFARDEASRALPFWVGCRTLSADEVLLLGDSADSFDGRYWGPVSSDLIEGVWRPL